ncbi:hypothetical protein AAWM_02946 [Aspergillus awamori]|uniref:Uncharacterized protein n=1 Tax=Aspergillus awamori TaxID=105351 RepID=A0A401KLE0_ASPAW|nr:hypothetical protein AAWM_02946 [Aspergillus awamori]
MNLTSFDNISIGVVAQILPLLGVFGQEQTNYFLCQSVDWFDYVLFAVGPLGVVWVVAATIRALGGPFLKHKIGRAFESEAMIERDLMSSTSEKVCELWNGETVDRLIGDAQIQEFWIIEKEDQGSSIEEPSVVQKRFFHSRGLIPEINYADEKELQQSKPPNLLLNLGSRPRRVPAIIATVIACIFQAGFLVLAVLTKFNPFLRHKFPTFLYAFICTVAGTGSLSVGLVLCAYQISKMTVRVAWVPFPRRIKPPHLVWLQRGLKDGDEKYTSYIIITDPRNEVLECHSRPSFYRGKRTTFFGALIVLCISAGYASQVVGVSGMHYPTQVTLFGGTILMALTRMALRQIPRPLVALKTHHSHEMDWLALAYKLDDRELTQGAITNVRPWAVNGGQDWRKCRRTRSESDISPKTSELLDFRQRISQICKWDCPVTERARSAAVAIECVANLWKIPEDEFRWRLPVDVRNGGSEEYLNFKLTKEGGRWKADEEYITSALSLWHFYERGTRSSNRENERSVFFLGPPCGREEVEKTFKLPNNGYRRIEDFHRLRYVKPMSPNEADEPETQVASFRRRISRNHIIGFQDRFPLGPPSSYQKATKNSFRYNTSESGDVEFCIAPSISGEEAAQKHFIPAIITFTDVATLYARHIFAGFMWAYAKEFAPSLITPDSPDGDVGLGDEEDVLLMVLPPLVLQKCFGSRTQHEYVY